MIFQALTTALIVGLAFFQALQGLYGSLIMALCAVLSAAVALNYFEPLSANHVAPHLPQILRQFADPAVLVLLFAASLAVLRISADKFLPGMVHFPRLADRIGGGAVGLISGLVIVGVLAIAFQQLPFGGSIGGYESLDRSGDSLRRRALWLNPDGFTIDLFNRLSNGSLSAGRPFDRLHPDYLLELAGSAAVPLPTDRQSLTEALAAVKIAGPVDPRTGKAAQRQSLAPARWIDQEAHSPVELLTNDCQRRQIARPGRETEQAEAALEFRKAGRPEPFSLLKVRLQLAAAAVESDRAVHLTGGQVLLVCRPIDEQGAPTPGAPGRAIPARWIVQNVDEPSSLYPFDASRVWWATQRENAPPPAEFVFAVPVPTDEERREEIAEWRPWFVIVKRNTRAEISMLASGERLEAPPGLSQGKVKVEGAFPLTGWRVAVGDEVRFRLTAPGVAGPIKWSAGEVELDRAGKLLTAHLQGALADFAEPKSAYVTQVSRLAPPEGARVVMLSAEPDPACDIDALWPALVTARVKSGRSPPRPPAGIHVEAENQLVFFYDFRLTEGRFEEVDLKGLKAAGGPIERIGLLLPIPPGASDFVLEFADGRKLTVNLTK